MGYTWIAFLIGCLVLPSICVHYLGDTTSNKDLIFRLRKRVEIRRSIQTRKSVQEGEPDRIADLLEEAADRLEDLSKKGDW